MFMKRKILFLCLAAAITLGSCNKSTCPTYDTGGGDTSKGGGKTKSGVYPKKMQKQLEK